MVFRTVALSILLIPAGERVRRRDIQGIYDKFFITTRHYNNRDATRHVATNAREPAWRTCVGGRALAALGTALTESAIANLDN